LPEGIAKNLPAVFSCENGRNVVLSPATTGDGFVATKQKKRAGRTAEQRRERNERERELAARKREQARAARQARLAAGGAGPMFLSRDDLRDFYGISYSRAHLYRLIAAEEFPAPVALGPHAYSRKMWRRDAIEQFTEKLKPAVIKADAA
jgi:predicted DNA-binding transcriptional regulator AlpA